MRNKYDIFLFLYLCSFHSPFRLPKKEEIKISRNCFATRRKLNAPYVPCKVKKFKVSFHQFYAVLLSLIIITGNVLHTPKFKNNNNNTINSSTIKTTMTTATTAANHIGSIRVQSSRTLFHHINDIQESFDEINVGSKVRLSFIKKTFVLKAICIRLMAIFFPTFQKYAL